MIYKFLKWFATIGIKFYYKNVFIYSEPNTANNTPTIYASNHPSGFYESIILASISKAPPIFLVRSDYVTIKGLMWLFKLLKLYPIYRQSEGLKDVNKNKEVFKNLNTELKSKTPICIYPEGTTKFQYKLGTIKKGISRLAIGALNDGIENINITPLAFNYIEPAEFRSSLFIYYGSPYTVSNANFNSANEPAQLRELTQKIKHKMLSVVYHFNNTERQNIFKDIQILVINNSKLKKQFKSYEFNTDLPKTTKNLSILIDNLEEEKYKEVKTLSNTYFELLKKQKISDNAVISSKCSIADRIKLLLGYPLFIIGVIVNIFPILLAYFIRKIKIKKYEYKAVVSVLIAQFSYLFYLIILFFIALKLFSYYGLLILALPLLAWYSIKYYDFLADCKAAIRFHKYKDKEKVIKLRTDICKALNI